MAERRASEGVWEVGRIVMVYFVKVNDLTDQFYQEARRFQSLLYAPVFFTGRFREPKNVENLQYPGPGKAALCPHRGREGSHVRLRDDRLRLLSPWS